MRDRNPDTLFFNKEMKYSSLKCIYMNNSTVIIITSIHILITCVYQVYYPLLFKQIQFPFGNHDANFVKDRTKIFVENILLLVEPFYNSFIGLLLLFIFYFFLSFNCIFYYFIRDGKVESNDSGSLSLNILIQAQNRLYCQI